MCVCVCACVSLSLHVLHEGYYRAKFCHTFSASGVWLTGTEVNCEDVGRLKVRDIIRGSVSKCLAGSKLATE